MKQFLQLNKLSKLTACPDERSDIGKLSKLYELFSSLLFYFSILIFIIGFGFADSPTPSGWYQQFMPNLNGAQISDITFVDSLNGFATTLYRTSNDSAYILSTTNSGDNWTINYIFNYPFYRIQFINKDTGYVLSFQKLFKTTNRGVNWQIINISLSTAFVDMYVLNTDSIWGVASESISGGVFLTINGGVSWQQKYSGGTSNPDHIYMYNRNIGFISKFNTRLQRTTNSGENWTLINDTTGFRDMYFADSLTGWKCFASMQKTTDGGLNWSSQMIPHGGLISNIGGIWRFSNINRDTIWGGGGYLNFGGGRNRGILYYTTNGGTVWRFQLPDTSFGIPEYDFVNFTNRFIGWGYESFFSQQFGSIITSGIHTTTGGNDTFYISVKQISSKIPDEYKLFQNYPNPFNPKTIINYQLPITNYVKLIVYDLLGKEIVTLVNEKQSTGKYQVTFDGSALSSGIYFYSLFADGKLIDTKKMILIK